MRSTRGNKRRKERKGERGNDHGNKRRAGRRRNQNRRGDRRSNDDINVGKERWRIIGVYVNEGIERMMRKMEKWTDKGEDERRLIIGGDFNARVGEKGVALRERGEGSGKGR